MALNAKPAAVTNHNRSVRAQAIPAATSPRAEDAAQTAKPQKIASLKSRIAGIRQPSIMRTTPPMDPTMGAATETKPQRVGEPGITEHLRRLMPKSSGVGWVADPAPGRPRRECPPTLRYDPLPGLRPSLRD